MKKDIDACEKAAQFIRGKLRFQPEIGCILGSGLGVLAGEVENQTVIPYADIPGFPVSTVTGHEGKLVCGDLEGKKVMILQGRFHYYEGYSMDTVVFPVRVMKLLGIKDLLVTNAAGGVSFSLKPGDLVLITDHIKFFSDGPLRGRNVDEFGPRFNDMSEAYSRELREMARETAGRLNIDLREGVYAFMPGPSYETPAEIKMLRVMGADLVGMSTVPEVTCAVHGEIRVMGISCVTNMAAGILDQPLNHSEVMETAEIVKDKFILLVKGIIGSWGR